MRRNGPKRRVVAIAIVLLLVVLTLAADRGRTEPSGNPGILVGGTHGPANRAADPPAPIPGFLASWGLLPVTALGAGPITPVLPSMDVGQTMTLTSAASGGTEPYHYQWYSGPSANCLNDTGIAGANGPTDAVSPTSDMFYCYTVTDSASSPATATSATDRVIVNPTLEANPVSPSAPVTNPGQIAILTANPANGTPPYHFRWYAGSSAGCASDSMVAEATNASLIVSPSTSTYYCYTVTDSSVGTPSQSATSGTDLLTVSTPSTLLGLPVTEGYTLVGGVVGAVVVLIVGVLIVRSRHRRREGTPPSEELSSSRSGPPGPK